MSQLKNSLDRPWYFFACTLNHARTIVPLHKHILIAVNELSEKKYASEIRELLDKGAILFLDSGIFNLSREHGRKHKTNPLESMQMAPEEIEGFDELFQKYCSILHEFKNELWGYVELDQGGMKNKVRIRAQLESMGFSPMPVYHPLFDTWEYFDELASKYPRLCCGNMTDFGDERIKMIATLWERVRSYPDLWVHILGYTIDELTLAYPFNSYDSSAWTSAFRWGLSSYNTRVMGDVIMDDNQELISGLKNPEQNKASILVSVEAFHYDEEILTNCVDLMATHKMPLFPKPQTILRSSVKGK